MSCLRLWLLIIALWVFPIQAIGATLEETETDCDANNIAQACYMAGVMYESGYEGTPLSQNKANHYFEKACEGGIASGCFNLGNNFVNSKGLPANITAEEKSEYISKGKDFWIKACDLGNFKACMNYAHAAMQFSKDAKSAAIYYEKACDLSIQSGCIKAADIYHLGGGKGNGTLSPTPEKAKELYAKANTLIQKEKTLESLVRDTDKKIFTDIQIENGSLKYRTNPFPTYWIAHLGDDHTLTLSHIMANFPDTDEFKKLVQEQDQTLKSNIKIETSAGSDQKYFVLSQLITLNGEDDAKNFQTHAIEAYNDLTSFMKIYSPE
tara:strand:+ start:3041 stop:4009 length:969 start_codon:yes stop_codon:yes gene_type:complete